jgi:hypothetical protein
VIGGTWCLRISEKEDQFVFEHDMAMMKPVMWDLGSTRNNYYRNMPTLELSNIGPVGSPEIGQLQLTIGDSRFHFAEDFLGAAAVIADSTPGFTLTPEVSPNGNLLTIDFTKQGGGGLDPGDIVRFRIDIDVDDNPALTDPPFYEFPDFRTVLFDMNAGGGPSIVQVYGPDPNFPPPAQDNALASVRLSNGTTLGPQPFLDQIIADSSAEFFNANFHPRGVMEMVHIFGLGGGGPNTLIPEPGSAMLLLLGLGGMLFGGRRPRNARPV